MAYKTFQNGYPLPASDLNNYLMNQSVIVFADVAARTAALPTPVEGMVTYLEDDNTLYVYTGADWVALGSPVTTEGDLIIGDVGGSESRLAIGTAGKVLTSNGTTASWEVASAGGMTELASGSLVSTNSLSLTGISQDYKDLSLRIYNISNSSTLTVTSFRVGGATSGHTASQLRYGSTLTGSTGGYNVTIGFTGAAKFSSFTINVPNYSETLTGAAFSSLQSSDETGTNNVYGVFGHNTTITSAITQLDLEFSQTLDSGSYVLYGVS